MALAKIIITCTTCGSQFEHRHTCRNRSDADAYESWASEHITTCQTCFSKLRAAAEKEARQKAIAATGMELVPLTGSEKQIAWASEIRERSLAVTLERLALYESVDYALIAAAVNAQPEARWWIDHRSQEGYSIIRECARAHAAAHPELINK